VPAHGLLERLRDDSVAVHVHPDQLQTELRTDRAHVGIGDRLAENGVPGPRQQAEDADHRAMRAGREEYPLLRWDERAASKPACGRVAVHRRSAEALVAEQRVEICGDARKPRAHPLKQLRIVRLGGHVHHEVGARALWAGIASHGGVPTNESAAADHGFDETALSGLDIAARDRGEVERPAPGQVSLRRQAIAGRQTSRRDVGRNRVGDSEIFRAFSTLQDWRSGLHGVIADPWRSELTADCWTLGTPPRGVVKLQKLASISAFDRIETLLTANLTRFTCF
jgi:hypothetical protein